MKENGLTMQDNSKFVDAVIGANSTIVEKVSTLAKLDADQRALEEISDFLNAR